MDQREGSTRTSAFGVGRREGHDSSAFYDRFTPPILSDDQVVNRPDELIAELGAGRLFHGSIAELKNLPDNSVALVVTSPPYFVGKEYELAVTGELDSSSRIPATYFEFLDVLRAVFAECSRVLEPGGRMAINVANLGRKPYRSLSADVISILQDDLGLLLRGEVIWEKASTSSGSCAWGSFAKASNPVLRDMTERVIIASKGQFARAIPVKARRKRGLPHKSSLANDEFVDVTRDVWRIDAESATRIGHPAPFPVELPLRLIDLYTYEGDLVVDPFVGSGTTLVAAARAGRIGIGYDTDDAYIAMADERLQAEIQRGEERHQLVGPPGEDPARDEAEIVAGLSFDDRQEHFRALAVDEGKKVEDIARRCLDEAGFVTIDDKAKHPARVVDFSFLTTNVGGRQWWVDVAGAFTTNRPGLQRIEAVWRLLGRLHVLQATAPPDQPALPVIIVTPSLPKPGSPADRTLRAVGPGAIFDAIELYDPAGLQRLQAYAECTGSDATPALPGFWTATELES